MSDKKTIQEALAEVQKNAELKKVQEAKAVWGDSLQVDEGFGKAIGLFSKGRKAAGATERVRPMPHGGEDLVGQAKKAPRQPETIDVKANEPPKSNLPAKPEEPKTGSAAGNLAKGAAGLAGLAALGAGGAYLYGKATGGEKTSDGAGGKADNTPAETPKQTTPSTPQTFGQAFSAARKAAGEKGAKSTGQFTWTDPKTGKTTVHQTNIKGAGTTAKPEENYVSMSKQTKVDIGGTEMPKTKTGSNSEATPSVPAQKTVSSPPVDKFTQTDKPFGPPTNKFTKSESESGGKRKKMSEETLDEMSAFDRTFAQKMKQLGPGKTYRDPTSGRNILLKYADNKPKTGSAAPAPAKSGSSVPLPPKRPAELSTSSSTWKDPGKLDYSKSNVKPATSTTGGIERGSSRDPVPSDVKRDTGVTGKPGGETGMHSDGGRRVDLQGKSVSVPTTDRSASAPAPTPAPSSSGASMLSPTSVAKQKTLESESGGKKKKMSEETNPLIAAFLKLQETKAPNIFEAAKKAKKSNDGNLANNYPPYDKVTRGDVIAGRLGKDEMGGKLKEGTAEAETSMSVTKDNKPSTPAQTNASTSGPSASDKAALTSKIKSVKEEGGFIRGLFTGGNADQKKSAEPAKKEEPSFIQKSVDSISPFKKAADAMTVKKEEVEFSQAEIDHINSFFEAVAPSRAEPTKGVNPSISDISLTDDTLQEGRPRKNPTPETSERDARQHIQVIAGRAAAGSTIDFPHNDGSKSKITPAMGRKITSHLQGLKPAERQAAVNKMHASAEGLKV